MRWLNFANLEIIRFTALFRTDWLNGYNLIEEGHVVWGWVMALLPFLPGAVVGVWMVWTTLKEGEYCMFVFALLCFVPGVVLGTPMYMAFVMLTSCIKFFKPDLNDDDDLFCGIDGGAVIIFGPTLRMAEIVGESCPQSMLGRFSLKLLCLSNQKKLIWMSVISYLVRCLHPDNPGPLPDIQDQQSAAVSGDRRQSDFDL